jgi:uncharacterized protein (DUF983 family)|tara:strand:- start:1301 stop:1537 length:237 start_codon:yes stop_codon:yes gene_type:complete
MRGKDMFGKGMSLKAEVTNGDCPLCYERTVFVSLYHNVYRCITCGGDTEQKVNGVIKYIPLSLSTNPTPNLVLEKDGS